MSRRFVVLALAVAAGSAASVALAKPPAPQPDPELIQQVAGLCPQLPHPTLTCSAVAVSCPSSPRAQIACKTVASVGPANADVQKLEVQLPRRYAKVVLTCRSDAKPSVTCRISSRKMTTATGVRVAVLRLPVSFATVRIACGTVKAKFGCKLQK